MDKSQNSVNQFSTAWPLTSGIFRALTDKFSTRESPSFDQDSVISTVENFVRNGPTETITPADLPVIKPAQHLLEEIKATLSQIQYKVEGIIEDRDYIAETFDTMQNSTESPENKSISSQIILNLCTELLLKFSQVDHKISLNTLTLTREFRDEWRTTSRSIKDLDLKIRQSSEQLDK